MGNGNQEITLYKNLKRRLQQEEDFNKFEMEPVEESVELALIEEEKGTMVEIEVNYEVDNYENLTVKNIENNNIDIEINEFELYEKQIKNLIEEVSELKSEVYSLKKENKKLENLLTEEQKLIFYRDDLDNNKLTKAEKLLLEKREELSRRSQIRKKGWLKQMLG